MTSTVMHSGYGIFHFKHHLIERKNVPAELKKLLEKCVSFSVDKRPADIEEMINVLEELNGKYPWSRNDAKLWWKNYDVYCPIEIKMAKVCGSATSLG